MVDSEEIEIRRGAMNQLLSQDDIDELFGRDQARLEKIQSLDDTSIPPEVDKIVSTFLAEYDIDIDGVDILTAKALRMIFLAVRVHGWVLKQQVLATKVREWLVEPSSAAIDSEALSPDSVFISTCYNCDEEIDKKRYECPNCGTTIMER